MKLSRRQFLRAEWETRPEKESETWGLGGDVGKDILGPFSRRSNSARVSACQHAVFRYKEDQKIEKHGKNSLLLVLLLLPWKSASGFTEKLSKHLYSYYAKKIKPPRLR